MRTIIIFIFAILVAGTAKCQAQVAPTTDVTLHIMPQKGGMELAINYDAERFLISDSAVNKWTFQFDDGTDIVYDKRTAKASKFNRILKKMEEFRNVTVSVGAGGTWRIYKYKL